MEEKTSAVARVCAIVELLDRIFDFVYGCPQASELQQSAGVMRVNKHFHSLAARHVWKTCGIGRRPPRPKLPCIVPEPHDLAKMVSHPERLQWYASCIQCLNFTYDNLRIGVELPQEEQEIIHSFNRLLPSVVFPRLKTMKVDMIDYEGVEEDSESPVPNLGYDQEFMMISTIRVSASFWSFLEKNCPQIDSVWMELFEFGGIERELVPEVVKAFCSFISHATKLTDLNLSHYQELWCLQTFLSIAQSKSIKKLDLGPCETLDEREWIEEMHRSVSKPFECLEKLSLCDTPHSQMNLLALYMAAKMNELQLYLIYRISARTFEPFIHFSDLQRISVDSFSSGTIKSESLLQMAQHCPRLISFSIHRTCSLNGDTITDSTIEIFVRALPNLEKFCLCPTNSKMTQEAVLHFGRRCKNLQELKLSATVDFVELAVGGLKKLFPKLRTFALELPPFNLMFETQALLLDKEAVATADTIARMMPNCVDFSIQHDGQHEHVTHRALQIEVSRKLRSLQGYPAASDVQVLDGMQEDIRTRRLAVVVERFDSSIF